MTLYKEVRLRVEACMVPHGVNQSGHDPGPWCIIVLNFTIPPLLRKRRERGYDVRDPSFSQIFLKVSSSVTSGSYWTIYAGVHYVTRCNNADMSIHCVRYTCTLISVVRLIYRVSVHALVYFFSPFLRASAAAFVSFSIGARHIFAIRLKKSCSLLWNGVFTSDESRQRKVNGTAIEIFTLVRKSKRKEDLPPKLEQNARRGERETDCPHALTLYNGNSEVRKEMSPFFRNARKPRDESFFQGIMAR